MPQDSSSKREQHEQVDEGVEPSPGGSQPRTAFDEVLHEVEEAGTRVGENGERREKDGESADAMTPNKEAQENDERGGA
ncbi:hypothetical protein [Streptomyces sp. ALB3]|uniref:hypothetical protein n=1 Tax=Streptomyces sp. ALB3 TaxID=3374278 RepID=UPI00378EB1CB